MYIKKTVLSQSLLLNCYIFKMHNVQTLAKMKSSCTLSLCS